MFNLLRKTSREVTYSPSNSEGFLDPVIPSWKWDNCYLDSLNGKALIAAEAFSSDGTGTVLSPDGTSIEAYSQDSAIKAGDYVIVIGCIEDVGLEVALFPEGGN